MAQWQKAQSRSAPEPRAGSAPPPPEGPRRPDTGWAWAPAARTAWISEPPHVDVNEILVRPTSQPT
jgi:hypothetical protein